MRPAVFLVIYCKNIKSRKLLSFSSTIETLSLKNLLDPNHFINKIYFFNILMFNLCMIILKQELVSNLQSVPVIMEAKAILMVNKFKRIVINGNQTFSNFFFVIKDYFLLCLNLNDLLLSCPVQMMGILV